ncbi:ABC transporter permease [Colwellia sp. 12G3]|uniref:ABC transporter permease n=1 Tax=Colwellia sp. 12G3 TaxID=2058299 RepID=UPI000C329C2E|nr:FtsX-like permease family protein [Colwellia sp. 12G3]PKI16411.1 permease [Colwellia sp. 12G3]
MLTNNIKLSWHFYNQEYQHPHQRLLRWTQAVLLLFIVTLSQSSDSIQSYLHKNLQGLLGADAVISQQQTLTAAQFSTVSALTNKIIATQQIQATLTHNGQWQQAKIKAVDNQYPLQGELLTSRQLQSNNQQTSGGPELGEIWPDSRLFASLALKIGDHLVLAEQRFLVSRVLQHEPDRLMEGHSVDMRAMINSLDLNTLNFSSDLIDYRYLIEATTDQMSNLIKWQNKNLPAAQIHHKQGDHPLALFWQRTENFIGLASIILFFMAAIAIEQLTQVHMKKDQYFSAICMSQGASNATGIQVSFFKWLIGIVLLFPVVVLLSTGFHWLIIDWLNDAFVDLVWQWNYWPTLKAIIAVVAAFAVFHAPVWFSLHSSSVAKLFIGNTKGLGHWFTRISSILVLSCVAITYSDNGLLTLMMVAAIVITIGLLILISWATLTFGEKLTQNISGLVPFTLFMMKQRLISKSTQILGVGLCAFLLLFTLMLLKDLGSTMASYQRQHDGNVMVSQATQSQLAFIESLAQEPGVTIRQVKPYIYAKLIAVNAQSLDQFSQKPSDSMATFTRAIRLHWHESIPQNNKLVDGHYWQATGKSTSQNWQQISVEQEVMTDLGLIIGDNLTFFIGQQSITFNITASHAFLPGAGSITFWVQMPTAALAHIQSPRYNMASIELDAEQWPLLAVLWKKFPTLRMISLKEMTVRFDSILAMITQVISGFSLMIILLAGIVILASINALESKEKKKNSIIMSFGFSRTTCFKLNVIEWLVTASIAGIGAIVGTYIAGLLIYQSQFSLTYKPDFIWLVFTLFTLLFLVTALGVYASRNNLRSSIRQLMSDT